MARTFRFQPHLDLSFSFIGEDSAIPSFHPSPFRSRPSKTQVFQGFWILDPLGVARSPAPHDRFAASEAKKMVNSLNSRLLNRLSCSMRGYIWANSLRFTNCRGDVRFMFKPTNFHLLFLYRFMGLDLYDFGLS